LAEAVEVQDAGEGFFLDDCIGQSSFVALESEDFLFHCVGGDEAISDDGLSLADSMRPVDRLGLNGRIPPRIAEDNVAGSGEVKPGAGGFDVFKARRNELVAFLIDRLRVQLRETGLAVGVITAVAYPNAVAEPDTDITRVISRANLLQEFLLTPQGEAMLGAYRRASNILRSEEKKEALNTGNVDEDLLRDPAETQLNYALKTVSHFDFVARDEYMAALNHLGAIRSPVDAFFKHVLVNDPDKKLRINRLRLLSRLKSAMESVADLSKIEA
jgi:glycyl-tRNA synthetase beta chain